MMTTRTQYETDADRENERDAINVLINVLTRSNAATYEVVKLSKTQRLDYALLKYAQDADGAEIAFVEVKCRNNSKFAFNTYMISASKFHTGIEMHSQGFKFILLVEFTDGLYWYMYDESHDIEYKKGGRTRLTRDAYDEEVCAYIPMKLFKPLAGSR